ncbi:MAG: glycosyltransferase family 4 protein, partial [Pseudomonadota bacterium]|nr:glycosyltransferase family 4 protein [Pseudomonadota bacterium]
FDVAVACRVRDHGPAIEAEGFRLLPLNWRRDDRSPLALFRAVTEITRLYRRERPDLVHHVAMVSVVLGGIAARLARVPHVVSAFTGLGHLFTENTAIFRLFRLAAMPILRLVVGNAAIFQNPDDRDLLLSRKIVRPGDAVLIRGSGVDTEHFAVFDPPDQPPVVLALVARMLSIKGVYESVAAIRSLPSNAPALRLELVGAPDPCNPSSLTDAELMEFATDSRIVVNGVTDDVRTVWARAHIALLPCRTREGVPKSLIEAASCARPIIATDVAGVREIARDGNNALLVPPCDVEALADAILKLVRDPELRARMGAAGRKLVLEEFSQEQVAAETLDLYRSLLYDRKAETEVAT